jgi:hypothetical protein
MDKALPHVRADVLIRLGQRADRMGFARETVSIAVPAG